MIYNLPDFVIPDRTVLSGWPAGYPFPQAGKGSCKRGEEGNLFLKISDKSELMNSPITLLPVHQKSQNMHLTYQTKKYDLENIFVEVRGPTSDFRLQTSDWRYRVRAILPLCKH